MNTLAEYTNALVEKVRILEAAESEGDAALYERTMGEIKAIQCDRDLKLHGCLKVRSAIEYDIQALDAEIARLGDRRAALKRKSEWFKGYIGACLGEGNTWKNPYYTLSWRKSEAVEITDESLIPPAYVREVVERKPDKDAIKADIRCGAQVPGCVLKVKQNLQVR